MTVAWDLETKLIEAGNLWPEPVCLTWCGDDMVPHIVHAKDMEPVMLRLLTSSEVLVGANVSYDAGVIFRHFPSLRKVLFQAYFDGRIRDIQIDQRLIDLAQGRLDGYRTAQGVHVKYYYSLAALYDRLGFGQLAKGEDTWRLRYGELLDTPIEQWPQNARDYALNDAVATQKVYGAQTSYQEWLLDSAPQARAAFALHLQSCIGMVTDEATCRTVLEETKAELDRCKRLLLEHELLRPIGSKDTKKAKARMEATCEALGIKPKLTDSGGICLDAEACRDSGDPILKAYAAFTSADKTITRVTDLAKGVHTPLQTRYVTLLSNGRTSSSEPSAPLIGSNFQNLPKDGNVRRCFVPRPGFVYCSTDFSMHEIGTFAQVELWTTGKSRLATALNDQIDVHSFLASKLLNCSYDEVLQNKKQGRYVVARNISKNCNFGLIAGMGIQRFMATCNVKAKTPEERLTERRAKELKELWLKTWDTYDYFTWVQNQLSEDGRGLGTLKAFISGRVRAHVDFATFANGCFSSLAADAAKSCLLPLAHEAFIDAQSDYFGSVPVLYIHDEVLAEVPEHKASAAAKRMTQIMLDNARRYTPDVRLEAEPTLMRCWDKRASAKWSPDGELLVWEPT